MNRNQSVFLDDFFNLSLCFLLRSGRLLHKQLQLKTATNFGVRSITSIQGDLNLKVPQNVRQFIDENVAICQPDSVHVCDGTDAEYARLIQHLTDIGVTKPLKKYPGR